MKSAQRWHEFWFAPEAPLNLGICRALFYAAVIYSYGMANFAPFAAMGPRSAFWDPIWLFETLHLPVFLPAIVGVMQIVWKLSLVMACLGLLTRVSTLVAFALGAYLLGLSFSFGKIEHQTMPMIVVMGLLVLARCGDGFSFDALLAKKRGKPSALPSGEYRWPVRAVWLLLAITFFAAGIAKLRYNGIRWATGPGFSLLLLGRMFEPNPPMVRWGLFIAAHPLLAHLFAAGSLATELSFPLALLDRRARRLIPLATFGMQLGIGLLMNVWFIQFLAIYAFWVPWGRLLGNKPQTAGQFKTAAMQAG